MSNASNRLRRSRFADRRGRCSGVGAVATTLRQLWLGTTAWALALLLLTQPTALAAEERPVLVGINAEFGLAGSTSAQAIERGVRIAVEEVNRRGGVLGGRPLAIVVKDDRSLPTRSARNCEALAAMPDLVAVFGGRFSPAVAECVPIATRTHTPLLLPWSAADRLVDNGFSPNVVFRLSLRDSWAIAFLVDHARARGYARIGLLTPNNLWGRSAYEAMRRYLDIEDLPRSNLVQWFNWGDRTMIDKYQALRRARAEAIIFIANDAEAVMLVRELSQIPAEERVPILSHWGVTGARFVEATGAANDAVDLTVLQTFSFFTADPARAQPVLALLREFYGVERIEEIQSPVGIAHAYDLMHILARAIDLAGSTDRRAIRDALERITDHDGLIKTYPRPFTPERHEALTASDIFLARFSADGSIRPVTPRP